MVTVALCTSVEIGKKLWKYVFSICVKAYIRLNWHFCRTEFDYAFVIWDNMLPKQISADKALIPFQILIYF